MTRISYTVPKSHKQGRSEKEILPTCTDNCRLGIASQAVLEDPGEFAVPVGDVRVPPAGTGELLDDLAQRHQALNSGVISQAGEREGEISPG